MNQGRILIANAHFPMMAGVRHLLKDRFEVTVMVADDQSLQDVVKTSQFDLVIADLSIPTSSGENVARLLKRVSPGLKVIILSIHDEPAVVWECLAAGAQGFVLKQATVNDLIPAVESVLMGGTYVSPCIQARREEANRCTTKSEGQPGKCEES